MVYNSRCRFQMLYFLILAYCFHIIQVYILVRLRNANLVLQNNLIIFLKLFSWFWKTTFLQHSDIRYIIQLVLTQRATYKKRVEHFPGFDSTCHPNSSRQTMDMLLSIVVIRLMKVSLGGCACAAYLSNSLELTCTMQTVLHIISFDRFASLKFFSFCVPQ